MNNMNDPASFLIKQADIGALFAGELGLKINAGSVLYPYSADRRTDTDIRSVYGELLTDGGFLRAARIVAEPDLYALIRNAGIGGLSETRLHRKKTEGDCVVVTEQKEDGDLILSVFDDYGAYLDLWSQSYAGSGEDPTASFFPPEAGLEEFLFILHAVDAFRRVSYQNMLDHVFTEKAYIRLPEFLQSMASSIKSLDIRWLLPAFLTVLPGVERYGTEIDPKDVSLLLEYDFFEQRKLASGEVVLAFGDAGQLTGVEFLRSWFTSCGFEINVAGPGGFAAVERHFIAPTVLTIHFVQLRDVADGKALVNYQPCTAQQLRAKLGEVFEAALTMPATQPVTNPPVTPQRPAPPNPPVMPQEPVSPVAGQAQPQPPIGPRSYKFCRNCGKQISYDAAFCGNCGAKQR